VAVVAAAAVAALPGCSRWVMPWTMACGADNPKGVHLGLVTRD
jgi:hypothetical protein